MFSILFHTKNAHVSFLQHKQKSFETVLPTNKDDPNPLYHSPLQVFIEINSVL